MGRGNFEREQRPIVKYRDTSVVISAKMAEPIEMPFGLWARMGPRNHVLDGSPEVLRDIAMVTTFWLSMGYNFGCVIANGTIFDSRGWVFGIKLSDEDIADLEVLSDVAMATNFGTKIAITGFV